jgi:hypothetical protein
MAIAAPIGAGTATPSNVPTKRANGRGVQIRQCFTPSLQEYAHVGRGSQVPDDSRVTVAVTRQRIRKTIDVRAAESVA